MTQPKLCAYIGVASPAMGHWGMCPLDFQLFNFSGHFRVAETLKFDSMWLPTQKNIQVYSFVFCTNFIMFYVSLLNYFLLVSYPSSH